MPEPITIKVYPDGHKRTMVRLIGFMGIASRKVYVDDMGVMWTEDISTNDPWYHIQLTMKDVKLVQDELMKLVFSVDLSTPTKRQAYISWQENDGSKEGLLKLKGD